MRYENSTAISHGLSKIKMLATVTLFLSIWVLAVSITIAVQAEPDGGLSVIDTMITVGENRLHFQIIEGGSPTILLEAGGGMDLTEWADLAPRLARETSATVVSYDRAGFGKSDLPETPCDMKVEAVKETVQKVK